MKYLFLLFLFTISLFSSTAFIDSDTLAKKIHNKNLVIIDTTNKQRFQKEHIINSVQVDIGKFRHQVGKYQLMNSSKDIQKIARELGINNDSEVIIYGHSKAKELLKSSYIALALIVNGLSHVSLLDGGFNEFAYDYDNLITTEIKTPKTGNFTANYQKNILVDMYYVKNHIGKTPMIEARPLKYFNGSTQSKGVKRLGHITQAKSSYWHDKFNSDETLKSDSFIKKIFIQKNALDKNKEVITYCTGGLEASMNWYILTQHLHFKDVKIYDASMREWGNIDSTPMEK